MQPVDCKFGHYHWQQQSIIYKFNTIKQTIITKVIVINSKTSALKSSLVKRLNANLKECDEDNNLMLDGDNSSHRRC